MTGERHYGFRLSPSLVETQSLIPPERTTGRRISKPRCYSSTEKKGHWVGEELLEQLKTKALPITTPGVIDGFPVWRLTKFRSLCRFDFRFKCLNSHEFKSFRNLILLILYFPSCRNRQNSIASADLHNLFAVQIVVVRFPWPLAFPCCVSRVVTLRKGIYPCTFLINSYVYTTLILPIASLWAASHGWQNSRYAHTHPTSKSRTPIPKPSSASPFLMPNTSCTKQLRTRTGSTL